MKSKILLVEDDLNMGFLLSEFLEDNGFEVKLCRDGESGLAAYKRSTFDLCILDVMMPRMDGFTIAKKINEVSNRSPFLFLTARSMKADKLNAYDLGAEDYVTKPFDEDELLCKIKVLIRRKNENPTLPTITKYILGNYIFDYSRQELKWETEIIKLTETEAEVLNLLCQNQNQILKREEAVEKLYGKKDYFLGRSFDVFISKLRKMLIRDERISIDNVFKVGFILNISEN